MRNFNNQQISSIIWLFIGICIVLNALFAYKIGRLNSPGPGFMPLLAGIAMSVFALAALVQGISKHRGGKLWTPVLKGFSWGKAFVVFGALIVYSVLFSHLGFIFCTVLFLLVMFRVLKPMSWLYIIPGSIVTTLAFYAIFGVWLNAQLPKGPWGF